MQRRDPSQLLALLHPAQAQAGFQAPESPPAPQAPTADLPVARAGTFVPELNAEQARALHLALHAPTGALIQGPPGTGKTTVIAQIVREMLLRGQRVLVCAQTNTAVDTILSKVVDAGVRSFLRIGRMEKSRELAATLEVAGADPAHFFSHELASGAESLSELANAIRTCPLVGCTTHAAVSSSVFGFLDQVYDAPIFDTVIVDEASQITEPMTLSALNRARRFVLVGDHRQLPPIVQSEQALSAFFTGPKIDPPGPDDDGFDDWGTEAAYDLEDERLKASSFELDSALEEAGVAGLDRSLFERLIEQLPHVMLREQYRMHADIMSYSNQTFYQGKLRAHALVADHRLTYDPMHLKRQPEQLRRVIDADQPMTFVHVEGRDTGRSNVDEARALVHTLSALLEPEAFLHGGAYGPKPRIGVVTPYRAQVQMIRDLLAKEIGNRAWNVDVDTVERYQGGERDIILVSLVKTQRAGDFLSDPRRLNVTLTRARKKIIVFGHRGCLGLSPLYRRLIDLPQTHHVDWE